MHITAMQNFSFIINPHIKDLECDWHLGHIVICHFLISSFVSTPKISALWTVISVSPMLSWHTLIPVTETISSLSKPLSSKDEQLTLHLDRICVQLFHVFTILFVSLMVLFDESFFSLLNVSYIFHSYWACTYSLYKTFSIFLPILLPRSLFLPY